MSRRIAGRAARVAGRRRVRTALRLLGTVLAALALLASRAEASAEAAFWRWFQGNEDALFDFERARERIFDRLQAELHRVDPRLAFEFGPKRDGRREFVLSADGVPAAFAAVESLYAAAPSLSRWQIVRFRPRREPFDVAVDGIAVAAGSVTVILHPDGARPGLTVFLPGYRTTEHRTYLAIAFLLLDQALGEYDVGTRVGAIAIQAPPRSAARTLSLRELPVAFDAYFARR